MATPDNSMFFDVLLALGGPASVLIGLVLMDFRWISGGIAVAGVGMVILFVRSKRRMRQSG